MDNYGKDIIVECKKLSFHNKILAGQIAIAIEGLNAIISAGDVLGLAQKTLDYMEKIEKKMLSEDNKDLN